MTTRGNVGVRILVLVLLAFALTWPQILHPSQLYGASGGEVDNHFWMFWVAAERAGLTAGPAGPLTDFPHGWEIPLMDPVNLPWWFLTAWIRPEVGYSTVLWANLALAGLGAGELAAAIHGRAAPQQAVSSASFWTGAVAGMASPPLLGFTDFGITEAWTVGWLGLHVAAMLTWGQTGRRMHLGLGTLAAAAVWGSGWYNAFFLVLLEPLVWVACRRWSWGLPVAAVVAAAPRLPALWQTHLDFGLWSSRLAGICAPMENRGWIARPFCGVDLLALVRPSAEPLLVSHCMYVGLVAVGLAGVAVVQGPNRARLALVAAVGVLWMLALGDQVRIAGHVVFPHGPAGWLSAAAPALRAITHWERAEVPAGALIAGLAGAGAVGLGRWWGIAPLALIADVLLFGGQRFPRQGYATDPPPELSALPGDGALAMIPVDNTFDPPQGRSRRPYNQWQVFFHRAVSENYEGPDDIGKYPAIKYLNRLCGVRPGPGELPPRPWDLGDLRKLGTEGFDWLVVVPELATNAPGCISAVTNAMGPPQVSGGRIVGWDL